MERIKLYFDIKLVSYMHNITLGKRNKRILFSLRISNCALFRQRTIYKLLSFSDVQHVVAANENLSKFSSKVSLQELLSVSELREVSEAERSVALWNQE